MQSLIETIPNDNLISELLPDNPSPKILDLAQFKPKCFTSIHAYFHRNKFGGGGGSLHTRGHIGDLFYIFLFI